MPRYIFLLSVSPQQIKQHCSVFQQNRDVITRYMLMSKYSVKPHRGKQVPLWVRDSVVHPPVQSMRLHSLLASPCAMLFLAEAHHKAFRSYLYNHLTRDFLTHQTFSWWGQRPYSGFPRCQKREASGNMFTKIIQTKWCPWTGIMDQIIFLFAKSLTEWARR